jgi:hypothetical protein
LVIGLEHASETTRSLARPYDGLTERRGLLTAKSAPSSSSISRFVHIGSLWTSSSIVCAFEPQAWQDALLESFVCEDLIDRRTAKALIAALSGASERRWRGCSD